MADSYVTYTGDGVQTDWTVPFPSIDETHVHVYVGTDEVTPGISWINVGTVRVTPAVANGLPIKIQRQTPTDPLVTLENTNNLTADDLNLMQQQTLYVSVE